MIKNNTLAQLRILVCGQPSYNYDLYNILSVIRGNDSKNEYNYKVITRAIRAYIGFNDHNCAGDTDVDYTELNKWIGRLYDRNSESDSHYQDHLRYAIESIGRDNLLDRFKK